MGDFHTIPIIQILLNPGMPTGHSSPSVCASCCASYNDRLKQLQKYINQMFLNLCKNQVLKQIYGTPELENLRFRKIEEILRDSLYGEKEQLIQSLIETSLNLQHQLNQREEGQNPLALETKIKHEKDMDILEENYKQMLINSLEEYQQEFNRLNLIYEREIKESKLIIDRYQQMHQASQTSNNAKQQLVEKDGIIKQLSEELREKQCVIREMGVERKAVGRGEDLYVVSISQKMGLLEKENKELRERVYMKDSENYWLRSRQSRIVTQAQNAIVQGQQFIMKTQVPEIILENQVQLYKLKEQYQTEIFMCHKKYREEIAQLHHTIQRLEKQKGQWRVVGSKDQREGVGRIAHVKKGYGCLINQFGKELGNVKKQFWGSRESAKKVTG